jgi:hypothetical protein
VVRRTHHPANSKAQKAPGSNIDEKESYMNASTIDTTLTPATPAVGHYRIDPTRTIVRFSTRHLFGLGAVSGTMAVQLLRSAAGSARDHYSAPAMVGARP